MAKTFSGGIKIRRFPLPFFADEAEKPSQIRLTIPADRPLAVSAGGAVKRGSLLAPACEELPALYSGLGGTVSSLEQKDGQTVITVTADLSLPDAEPLPVPSEELRHMEPDALRRLLLERGITPPSQGKRAMKCLLVDCSGDDPYCEAPAALTLRFAGDVVGGAKILMKLLSVTKCLFSVCDGHLDVANELERYLTSRRMLRVAIVKDKFPQSLPHLLVSSHFGVEINCRTPLDNTGYAVVSPRLCKEVFDALAKGVPPTDAVLTLAEAKVRKGSAQVVTVPVGTAFKEVPSLVGRTLSDEERTATGGGFRSRPVSGGETVTPLTESVILLPPPKKKESKPAACNGCGRCDAACPLHLLPSRLYFAVKRGQKKIASRFGAEECIGCGVCSLVCPAALPLTEEILSYQANLTGESDEG